MATSTTILNLQQLTDAALVGPDFGTVHFRLLHTTMQIIISQLGLQDVMVEFKGAESEMLQKLIDPKATGGIKSTQYNVSGTINKPVSYNWDVPDENEEDHEPSAPATTKTTSSSKSYDATRTKDENQAPNAPNAHNQSNVPNAQNVANAQNAPNAPNAPTARSSPNAPNAPKGSQSSKAPSVSKAQNISKSDGGSVVIVSTRDDRELAPAFTVAVTTDAFERLTKDVDDLKGKYDELTKMSSNTELMKAVRTSTTNASRPVGDMYQLLSLTKRIEAAELGMSKIASMIEDLAKEQVETHRLSIGPGESHATGGEGYVTGGEGHVGGGQSHASGGQSHISGGQTHVGGGQTHVAGGQTHVGGSEAVNKVIENATRLRASIDNGQGPLSQTLKDIELRLEELEKKFETGDVVISEGTHLPKIAAVGGPVSGEEFAKVDLVNRETGEALELIQMEFKNVRNLIQALDIPGLQKKVDNFKFGGAGFGDKETTGGTGGIVVGGGGDISERMAQMEMHFNQCLDHINSLDKMFHGKMETVAQQVASVEKELGNLTDKMLGLDDHLSISGAAEVNVLDLYKKFMELENVTNNIGQTAAELLDEREQRQMHMSSLLEQIEELKNMKADKQDVEGQLADKVDICMINKKVSHEQFDATCMDLTKGIEDALEKLTRQEELWQQALTDIQTEVGSKLDKMEIGPLKEFITHKLGVLQAKLRALAKFKKEQEAAGTKAALLKDVKCISCDQDVVMRKTMDPSLYPQPPSLPPTKTMAPYLAYELDQLRKQQRTLNTSRNLNHFEQIKKGDACNRYCGGSHTLTTPQQRVTRLGHFLEQWGPEISMANDSEIKGKDGMIYKGEEKPEITIMQPPPAATISAKRPSMVVQGDILANRPEPPERLMSVTKPSGKGSGGISFN